MKTFVTSGKRKSSVATAVLKQGNGTVTVNGNLLQNVTPGICRLKMEEPLILSGEIRQTVNVDVRVNGGGINSQAEAVRLAIAKALTAFDKKLHTLFLNYDRTLLVADVRQKETHKPNCHGKARSKRQKSYR